MWEIGVRGALACDPATQQRNQPVEIEGKQPFEERGLWLGDLQTGNASAGSRHPRHFCESSRDIGDIAQGKTCHHRTKGAIGERYPQSITSQKGKRIRTLLDCSQGTPCSIIVPQRAHLLLRYTQALLTQMAQTAVCNRHHSVDQQLCRWLLLWQKI